MPSGYPPSVFVSSTCYDLSQVRLDLKTFTESLGYVPVISESSAFPVNPQADNLENCIRAVRDRADIFVLIIGGRYGTQSSDGRSITNHEYLQAREKGVPIFVFITQSILHNLPIWKANPAGDFSSVVDSVKLFEFVQRLREAEGHWVFAFSNAAEIIETLRAQWALLFTDALREREKLRTAKLSPEILALPASCLRILLEKPKAWEHRFFSAALRLQITQHASLRRDIQYGLQLGEVTRISRVGEVIDWVRTRLEEIKMLVESCRRLVTSALEEALGPIGKPGNPELLAYVARRFGDIYGRLLIWTHDFDSVATDVEFERVIQLNSRFSEDVLKKLEAFPDQIDAAIKDAVEAVTRGEKYKGEIILTLNMPINPELSAEMDRLYALVASGRI